MPRRHRSARERSGTPEPPERPLGGFAPAWAQVGGEAVHAVSGEKGKTYRCPGCGHEIRPGVPHLVVVSEGDVEGRRHWHTPCWRQDLRRRRVG
jgi:hypothetical protein